MSLPRTLLKREAAIFATVGATLLVICVVAGGLSIVYAYALVYAALRFVLEVLYAVPDPRIRYRLC